ncbi:arsenite methyltransferase [Haloarchaeobius salinus]|uniref:arsenite methyltransferase n=1 Tax=Haloarchaeobius salinus TaxID=1198298 RepID=UPI002108DF84
MTDRQSTTDTAAGLDAATQRAAVRERYGRIAEESGSCCDDSASCCAETADGDGRNEVSKQHGYSAADLAAVDGDANLNLGCGNPTAIASLDAGDTVLDLGSGGGFDCFLAAREVGPDGHVVGVDMTPEMVETARDNVAANDTTNVEFRLGEIEHLPVADASVDVVISNCVVNLSPDKPQVLREAYRVLRPGGRVAISDVVLTADLPGDLRVDPESVAGCVGGAASIPELESMLTEAGFVDVAIEPKDDSDEFIREWDDALDLSEYIVAAAIEAERPDPEVSS